jgi:threonylcarbamoyladenosine tRNA methylthiotransferase MtaB
MQIYLDSIGCRLNWSEIEALAQQLTAAGHAIASGLEEADVIILNTCAVTAQAERKTRHEIRSLHRDNSDARIAVIGCYPTLRPTRSAEFPGVAWVVSNADKARTAEIVDAVPSASCYPPSTVHTPPLRTRAFVKVQDGCDNHCTYCIIRNLRGPGHSRPLDEVVAEVQGLVEVGCQEVVLTGVNLGSYGRDRELPGGLRTLVETLLAHTDIARLRLSSLEPWDVDASFFDLWEDPRLCRQLHMPLQAGCDATLRRMGRPITTETFARLVEAACAAIPGLAVTTDVLVGFPGEDEAAFRASYEFVERMAFAKLHVFPYSPRPSTPAARLPDRVPRAVRDERASRMRELGAAHRRRFRERFVGQALEVLWEKQWRDGRWAGWTDNYIRVVTAADASLENRITTTRLNALRNNYIEGEIVDE